ncbi:MAG: glycosyltransferase, partial [Proteobacteria bacterium]|nr:glycosyltransferase [Pseudomonadota bacterium]
MNEGLRISNSEIVLFLDDDIRPKPGLLPAHLKNYLDESVAAVAGQVIQPWESEKDMPPNRWKKGIWADLDFPFYSTRRQFVKNCIACNLSVRRELALRCGGFDERFVGWGGEDNEFWERVIRSIVPDTSRLYPDVASRNPNPTRQEEKDYHDTNMAWFELAARVAVGAKINDPHYMLNEFGMLMHDNKSYPH